MCRARGRDAEKSLSFCHLTKQRLINELADGVNERHCWPDDSSPDYRPKFLQITEKACGVLTLQLPKAAETPPRRIEVRVD
jgi:hypothetical protein